MQRVRRFEAEMATQLRGLQVHRLGHFQRRELTEETHKGSLQDRVAALDRPDQALTLHQRRDSEAALLGSSDRGGDSLAPPRMALDEVNHQASVEIDQSQDALSDRIALSISSAERRA